METGSIFIGGLSYSGKTYLRLMLLAHPNLVITRRTKMWTRYYGRFGDLASPENLEPCLEAMLQAKHIQALQPDPERIRREFAQGPQTYGRLFALFHTHHAQRVGKPRWGDQLGRVEAFADPIFAAYPDAKMIHMVRDPRVRTAANISTSRYRRAKLGWETAAWRRSAQLAHRNGQQYPNHYLILHYETLLTYPEKTLRQVCAFLDETFTPAMLNVENVPYMHNRIDHNDSNRLREESITAREIALLQMSADKEMKKLHYVPQTPQLSAEDYLLLPVVDWPLSLAGQLFWWMREGKQSQS